MVRRIFEPGDDFEGFTIEAAIDTKTAVQSYRATRAALPERSFVITCTEARGDRAREARFLAGLGRLRGFHHRMIPEVIAGGSSAKLFWIVTACTDSVSLRKRISEADRHLSLIQISQLGKAIAEALAAAQKAGILHRRLSPNRLLVGPVNQLELHKVLGVGVCDLLGDAFGEASEWLYRAPEEKHRFGARNRRDERADIYSLGMILYEVLATTPRLAGPDRSIAAGDELWSLPLGARPPRLEEVGPPFPGFLDDLLQEMLAIAPSERPASWGAVGQRFGALVPRVERWYQTCFLMTSLGSKELGKIALGIVEEPATGVKSGRKLSDSIRAGLNGEEAEPDSRRELAIGDIEFDDETDGSPWDDEVDEPIEEDPKSEPVPEDGDPEDAADDVPKKPSGSASRGA